MKEYLEVVRRATIDNISLLDCCESLGISAKKVYRAIRRYGVRKMRKELEEARKIREAKRLVSEITDDQVGAIEIIKVRDDEENLVEVRRNV